MLKPDQADSQKLLEYCEQLENAEPTPQLELPIEQFVDRFAQINVSTAYKDLASLPHGNAREEPSAFQAKCLNRIFGCEFTGSMPQVAKHKITCPRISIEAAQALDQAQQAKTLRCDRTDCGKSFDNKRSLSQHKCRAHKTWAPRKCPDCADGEVYTKKPIYARHRSNFHSDWVPSPCPIGNCKNAQHIFAQRPNLNSHLLFCHTAAERAVIKDRGLCSEHVPE